MNPAHALTDPALLRMAVHLCANVVVEKSEVKSLAERAHADALTHEIARLMLGWGRDRAGSARAQGSALPLPSFTTALHELQRGGCDWTTLESFNAHAMRLSEQLQHDGSTLNLAWRAASFAESLQGHGPCDDETLARLYTSVALEAGRLAEAARQRVAARESDQARERAAPEAESSDPAAFERVRA